MGNEYYLFEVSKKIDTVIKEYKRIEKNNIEYISYDRFLKREYFTDIEGNCDFIPWENNSKVKLILRKDQFEVTEIEDVFEILFDTLYGGEKEYEENINC